MADPIRELATGVLEVSYRATVAIHVIGYRLVNWHWLVKWYEATRESVDTLLAAIDPMARGGCEFLYIQPLADAHLALSRDLTTWLDGGDGCNEVNIANGLINPFHLCRDQLRNSMAKSKDNRSAELLAICEHMGRQLAVDDIVTFPLFDHEAVSAIHDGNLKVNEQARFDPYGYLSEVFGEGASRELISLVNLYLTSRTNVHVAHAESFECGGCFCLFRALLDPEHSPSIVWALPNIINFKAMWSIVCAGPAFRQIEIMRVKNKRDLPLLLLLEIMRRDKTHGKQSAECGWIKRSRVTDNRSYDGAKHAWNATIRCGAPLGEFEFIPANKKEFKNHGHKSECRAPRVLADINCLIVLEKSSK